MVAQLAQRAGEFEAAQAGFAEAAALCQQMRDRFAYTVCRSLMGHLLRQQGRPAEAAVHAETLPVWVELGHRAAVAYELECPGYLAAADRQSERAATLFGAAEALRERIGSPMTANERGEYEAAVAQARAQAEPAVFEAAWTRGRALTMDQAVAYALNAGS